MKDDASKWYDKMKTKKPLKCWICEEPHTVNNCVSRQKVAAVAQFDANKKEEKTSIGVMQILGAVVATEAVSR